MPEPRLSGSRPCGDADVSSGIPGISPLHDVKITTGLGHGGLGFSSLLDAARRLRLVEPDGIEPTTSCLQSRRSPN